MWANRLIQKAVEALIQTAAADRPVRGSLAAKPPRRSVAAGARALPAEATGVLIHVRPRCLVAAGKLIGRCGRSRRAGEAVIAATPVSDTIQAADGAAASEENPGSRRALGRPDPPGLFR